MGQLVHHTGQMLVEITIKTKFQKWDTSILSFSKSCFILRQSMVQSIPPLLRYVSGSVQKLSPYLMLVTWFYCKSLWWGPCQGSKSSEATFNEVLTTLIMNAQWLLPESATGSNNIGISSNGKVHSYPASCQAWRIQASSPTNSSSIDCCSRKRQTLKRTIEILIRRISSFGRSYINYSEPFV